MVEAFKFSIPKVLLLFCYFNEAETCSKSTGMNIESNIE